MKRGQRKKAVFLMAIIAARRFGKQWPSLRAGSDAAGKPGLRHEQSRGRPSGSRGEKNAESPKELRSCYRQVTAQDRIFDD